MSSHNNSSLTSNHPTCPIHLHSQAPSVTATSAPRLLRKDFKSFSTTSWTRIIDITSRQLRRIGKQEN